MKLLDWIEMPFVEAVIFVLRLPGKLLIWPVSLLVRIPPRHLLSIEVAVGTAIWVGLALVL